MKVNGRLCDMSRVLKISIFALLLANSTFAQNPKMAPGLEALEPNSTVDVIVQYAHAPTERHHQLVRSEGGLLKRQLDLIQAEHYAVPARALQRLTQDPEVIHIS